jgi:hypothetical protein
VQDEYDVLPVRAKTGSFRTNNHHGRVEIHWLRCAACRLVPRTPYIVRSGGLVFRRELLKRIASAPNF